MSQECMVCDEAIPEDVPVAGENMVHLNCHDVELGEEGMESFELASLITLDRTHPQEQRLQELLNKLRDYAVFESPCDSFGLHEIETASGPQIVAVHGIYAECQGCNDNSSLIIMYGEVKCQNGPNYTVVP